MDGSCRVTVAALTQGSETTPEAAATVSTRSRFSPSGTPVNSHTASSLTRSLPVTSIVETLNTGNAHTTTAAITATATAATTSRAMRRPPRPRR